VNARAFRSLTTLVLLMAPLVAACGKKGPPLPPLRLTPGAVTEPTGRRTGQEVELRFGIPTTNVTGPGTTLDLDHIEVYAVTVAPGGITPANRLLMSKQYVVATIPVKPAPLEGQDTSADKRPAPGERISWVEELTEAKMTPKILALPKPPAAAGTSTTPAPPGATTDPAAAASATAPTSTTPPTPVETTPETTAAGAGATTPPTTLPGELIPLNFPTLPGTSAGPPVPVDPTQAAITPPAPATAPGAAPAVAPVLTVPTRTYIIRGISRAGNPGQASIRLSVPLLSPVSAPSGAVAQMPTEGVTLVEWTPPVAEAGASPLTFNVYRQGETANPVNTAPIKDIKFDIPGLEYGKEHCFVVSAVQTHQAVTIESDVSPPACLTPVDKFPPAAPKGLRAVAEDGAVSLVWETNSEADFGGFLVLRGEGGDETLQPITPQPIKDANYRDTGVKPGVRYVYVVVAVDTATPRNTSPRSTPEGVTAR
jgi:predicted small lipoprotein YifL